MRKRKSTIFWLSMGVIRPFHLKIDQTGSEETWHQRRKEALNVSRGTFQNGNTTTVGTWERVKAGLVEEGRRLKGDEDHRLSGSSGKFLDKRYEAGHLFDRPCREKCLKSWWGECLDSSAIDLTAIEF